MFCQIINFCKIWNIYTFHILSISYKINFLDVIDLFLWFWYFFVKFVFFILIFVTFRFYLLNWFININFTYGHFASSTDFATWDSRYSFSYLINSIQRYLSLPHYIFINKFNLINCVIFFILLLVFDLSEFSFNFSNLVRMRIIFLRSQVFT